MRGWLLAVAILFAIAIAVLLRWREGGADRQLASASELRNHRTTEMVSLASEAVANAASEVLGEADAASSRAVVARQAVAFARDRRMKVHLIAEKLGIAPPSEFDEFFAAAEAGRWGEMDVCLDVIMERFASEGILDGPQPMLAPVFETYCVADLVQTMPADRLLEFGRTFLESIGSADVYISTTDLGQWIPALLNVGRDAGPKIIIAESHLADPTYVEYLGLLYGGQLHNLNSQDLSRARQASAMAIEHDTSVAGADDYTLELSRQLRLTLTGMNPHLSFALETKTAEKGPSAVR